MMTTRHWVLILVVAGTALLLQPAAVEAADDAAGPVMSGWRGNGTGLFPDAEPVTEWGRKSKGIVAGLRISTDRPAAGGAGDAELVRDHFPREWLILGPFSTPKGLGESPLPGEADVGPAAGEKVGDLVWQTHKLPDEIMPPWERGSVAGAVNRRPVRLDKVLGGFKPDSTFYACTYLHSPAEGDVDILLEHSVGMALRLNGKQVYRQKDVSGGLGGYTQLGKRRASFTVGAAPRARGSLKKGWNRLLVKLSHYRKNHRAYQFHIRIVDLPEAPHEDRNILWAAPIYDRSNATPIVVGNRVFAMAEPEQLICLDKTTGKQLWTRFLGRYQATPKAERDANPAFKEKLAPLVAQLPEAKTFQHRMDLRKKIDAALVAIDSKTYKLQWDGHMRSHFRVVGWTIPTPCSDGKYVYVWCGNGVAACYDLKGNTRWIRRVRPGKMFYPSSPTLIDGKFVIFFGRKTGAVALDAATGKELWRQPKLDRAQGALMSATINGVSVIIGQPDVVRASDGHALYVHSAKMKNGNCASWAPPMIAGNVLHQTWHTVDMVLLDFAAAKGDTWIPRAGGLGGLVVSRSSTGKWVDKATCGSPLIHEGIYYNVDVFGTLYAADMKTRKLLFREDLSGTFNSLSHYNAVGVAASVTLGGKHLYVMDNQGTCVVFKPGREFKKVAVNRIENTVRRPWPMRPQEEIGYSPPVFDGKRMYLRGEHYLYCIGAE